MRGILLALLGLPLVAGFGGLSWVRTAGEPAADGTFTQPATVLRPPGDATFASGWDQTEGATPAATALIGNTRVNVWKWVTPPPPPPPQPPANCCEIYPLGVFESVPAAHSLTAPSWPADATVVPSGENSIALTAA